MKARTIRQNRLPAVAAKAGQRLSTRREPAALDWQQRERSVGSESKTSDRSTMEAEDEVVKKQRKKTVDVCSSAANQSIGSKSKTSARCTTEAEDEVVKKKRRKKTADVCLSAANQSAGSKRKTSAMCISEGNNQIVKRRKKKDAHNCSRKKKTETTL